MTDELIVTPVPEVEPEFKTTLTPEQLAAAEGEIRGRSFSGRHPELGKMINCPVHGRRHRRFEFGVEPCKQTFTYEVKDKDGRKYRQYTEVEGKDGEVSVTPDFRTAIPTDQKPTMKQIVGRAATAKKRFHPHPSKIKLLFIQRVREVFEELGFELVDAKSEEFKALMPDEQRAKAEQANKDLHRARVVAARRIRKERELSDREYRRRTDVSRRINRGLL
jgi:hypothetical protein